MKSNPFTLYKRFISRNNQKKSDYLEFLPAAIEIEQTPASPVGQTILWVISLLFVIAIAWSIIGRVDIVATAQGKVITSERTKQIQPIETGTIQNINVREGEYVNSGDLLIALNSDQAKADLERFNGEIEEPRCIGVPLEERPFPRNRSRFNLWVQLEDRSHPP